MLKVYFKTLDSRILFYNCYHKVALARLAVIYLNHQKDVAYAWIVNTKEESKDNGMHPPS